MSERGHIPQPGDVLAGKYAIEGRLGQGGMGLVLAARNVRTHRRVAIKWLLPRLMDNASALKRFEREAQVAGEIDHPNVVNVYDIERDADTLFIVMELLEGQSLAERLAQGRSLPLAEAAPIFMGVLRGVAAAHAAGVVHRDLKPDNVFLCRPRDGSAEIPKVLDFGISKLAKRENVSTITEEGSLIGTMQYMSPEQLRGQETDERTDVYALGVILYRMLSGQMPFQGANHIDLVLNMASHPARPLSDHLAGMPEGLERAVARALEREAGSRFESVEAFARALEPYFGGHVFQLDGRAHPSVPAGARESKSVETTPFVAEDRPVRDSRSGSIASVRGARFPSRLIIVLIASFTGPAIFGYMQWQEHQARMAAARERIEAVRASAAKPPAERTAARGERAAIQPPAPGASEPRPIAGPAVAPADAGVAVPEPAPRRTPATARPRVRTGRPATPASPSKQEALPVAPAEERPFRAGKPDRDEF